MNSARSPSAFICIYLRLRTSGRSAQHERPQGVRCPHGARPAQIPTDFCPRLDDKISLSVNSMRASRSIAAGTSMAPRIAAAAAENSSKNAIFKTNIRFFLSPRNSGSLGVSRSLPHAPRQNHPILSPSSDFPTSATKFPLRNSSIQTTFVQPNCNDRIPPPLLAPHPLPFRPFPNSPADHHGTSQIPSCLGVVASQSSPFVSAARATEFQLRAPPSPNSAFPPPSLAWLLQRAKVTRLSRATALRQPDSQVTLVQTKHYDLRHSYQTIVTSKSPRTIAPARKSHRNPTLARKNPPYS
jgi:hypothetical protein